MNIGEKIKQYRKLRKLTQKALAEQSGISEISIRKYEAGERIPKQDQLHKLAEALDVGVNYLYDIKLDKFSIQTVGDFMSMIFMLEDKVGMQFKCEYNKDHTANPETISISFENKKANSAIAKLLSERNITKYRNHYVNNVIQPPFEKDKLDRLNTIDAALLEVEQTKLTESQEPIDED